MAEPADESEPSQPVPAPNFISYAAFGRRFFEIAVTRERILAAVDGLSGRAIDVGPLSVGPLGLAKVRANGGVGEPLLEPVADAEHLAFTLTIPADLQMQIQLGLDTYRFTAGVRVTLLVTARAAERLRVVIDVERPSRRNIEVDLHAEGLRASVIQQVGSVETEVKRTVATFVAREIEKSAPKRVIDVEQILAGRPRSGDDR